jgi:hypothetical protein
MDIEREELRVREPKEYFKDLWKHLTVILDSKQEAFFLYEEGGRWTTELKDGVIAIAVRGGVIEIAPRNNSKTKTR